MWRRTQPTRTRRPRARRPGLERLEGRALLAGNVTTAVRSYALLITGDGAGDKIEVDQDGPGRYLITGQGGTTVDGKPSEVVAAQKDLRIDLGGGQDEATLDGVTVSRDALIANCHTVDLSGTCTIGRDLTITTGDGSVANVVSIDGTNGGTTTVGRDLTVTTGDGTVNGVGIFSTTVGRDLTATTGDGTAGGNGVQITSTEVGRDLTVTTVDGTATGIGSIGTLVIVGQDTVGRDLSVTIGDSSGDPFGSSVQIVSNQVGRDLTLIADDGSTPNTSGAGNILQIASNQVGRDLTVTTGDGSGGIGNNV
jgi:hypothetical protein